MICLHEQFKHSPACHPFSKQTTHVPGDEILGYWKGMLLYECSRTASMLQTNGGHAAPACLTQGCTDCSELTLG